MHPRTTLIVALSMLFGTSLTAAPERPGVIVATVQFARFVDRTEALGTLRANESVVITATVTETISALHFDDGQRVQQGEVLVEMTSAEEHALIEEARVRVAEAERQFRRVKSLEASGSASTALLDERRRDLDTAGAALLAVESRLNDRLIKAPFAGVIGLRTVSPGTLVTPGEQIATLDDDRVMKLDFAVPSVYLESIAPGLRIEARAPALGRRLFAGDISAIDSRVDPITRTVRARALIDNPARLLRPGLMMQVELLRNPRDSLSIPEAAILHRGSEHFALRVDTDNDNRVERRALRVGARRPGEIEVLDGLKAGETVIAHGQDRVRPGQSVVILERDGERAPVARLERGAP